MRKPFATIPDALGRPSGCPLPLEVGAKEDEELAYEGSDSMDAGGQGRGGAAAGCALCKGIPSKGASRSKNGLKT